MSNLRWVKGAEPHRKWDLYDGEKLIGFLSSLPYKRKGWHAHAYREHTGTDEPRQVTYEFVRSKERAIPVIQKFRAIHLELLALSDSKVIELAINGKCDDPSWYLGNERKCKRCRHCLAKVEMRLRMDAIDAKRKEEG